MSKRIAIIGAGLSGAVLAHRLCQAGHIVTVFEKSRGTGGRIASSRIEGSSADIGLPYFNDVSDSFTRWLKQQACITSWVAQVKTSKDLDVSHEYLVAVPRLSSLTRALLADATLVTRCRISHIWPDNIGVVVRDEDGNAIDHFDAVVITAPAPQAAVLLEALPRFAHKAESVTPTANWVALVGLTTHSEISADILWGSGVINRAVRDSSKPEHHGGKYPETWVIEASTEWTNLNLETPKEDVAQQLISAFNNMIGLALKPGYIRAHRWLYARHTPPTVKDQPNESYLWSKQDKIGVCGDWLLAGDATLTPAEAAWKSAQDLSDALLIELA